MAMLRFLRTAPSKIYPVLDWFTPAGLTGDSSRLHCVRMFLISHLFGPFVGHTLSISILFLGFEADAAWWTFFWSITAFWGYPWVLRLVGPQWYDTLALVSVQNLIFCILWGCYHYGGLSSPIVPWLITVPLLAFFYLGSGPKTIFMVLSTIVLNLIVFYLIYSINGGFPERGAPTELSGLGLVSTFCAGVYVAMMALYYANIVSSQSELEHEAQRHMETARQLREATELAQRANRAKSEFLAKMSHELRTPLNAIIGYSEMLIEDAEASGGTDGTDDLRKINGAGKELLSLVGDLLDLAKLEAGKMDLFPERFDLAEFVEGMAARWRETIAGRGVEFRVECPAAPGAIVTDEAKLRQALSNLMSNAAKFTEAGCITLRVASDGGWVAFAVEDSGPGIRPEAMDTLFETFAKDEEETASKYVAAGLGLPLSKRLCHLIGGDLTVESTLGRGSCFTIRVPADIADRTALEAAHAPTGAAGPAGADDLSALLIDDDPQTLDLLERILGKEGLPAVVRAAPAKGLEHALRIRPSIVFLGVDAPGFDGWSILRDLRHNPALRSCRIVLLTVTDDFRKGRSLGADAHLPKPIDRDAVLRLLAQFRPETAPAPAAAVPAAG
jgi:signal transduction histidine kinase/ActR/RegA family two-component response regulator